MDPLAHTLFGATMAEAGLKRKTALATATLIIGANIPDIDAAAMLVSSDYALLVRRGWTHGILALFIWPFLLTGIMLVVDRLLKSRQKARPGPPVHKGWLLGVAFLGVWSHPLLDWLNTYGVRILMPFDGTWFYGDTLFIIDPWLWLLVGAGVVLARSNTWKSITGWIVLGTSVSALVLTADIVPFAAKIVWSVSLIIIVWMRWSGKFREQAQSVALGLLIMAIGYATFMFTGARMAVNHAQNYFAGEGISVNEIMPNPLPARLLLRTGVAASDTHYHRFTVNWTDSDSFQIYGDPIPIEIPDTITSAALEADEVRGLMNWIRFPLYEVREEDNGWLVIIRDLRYVEPGQDTSEGIGMAFVYLNDELDIVRVGAD